MLALNLEDQAQVDGVTDVPVRSGLDERLAFACPHAQGVLAAQGLQSGSYRRRPHKENQEPERICARQRAFLQ